MLNIKSFIKGEILGWNKYEIAGIFLILCLIFYNAFCLEDSVVAVISAICGIMYTIIAGKGKISCYIFGLTGSGLYGYLAFTNGFYGNFLLYVCYYIPMQILGIFRWKNNLNKVNNEIYKIELDGKNRIKLSLVSVLLCCFGYVVLRYMGDSNPVIDSAATMLSIVGMYLTVRRAIEQWIIWMIVNALSLYMWIQAIQNGVKTYSTALMWGVYLVLAVYFYVRWRKEINQIKG